MKILLKIILMIIPLALTPVFAYLISDDYLDFGGGDKDIVLIFPWMLWSAIYLIAFIVTWVKNKPLNIILITSILCATFGLIATLIVSFFSSAGIF